MKTILKEKRGFISDVDIKKILARDHDVTLNFFAKLIANVLELPIDEVKRNLKMEMPDVSVNKELVKSEVDYVLENDTRFINIEFNNLMNKENMVKNNAYICQLYLKQLPNKESYKKIKPVTQICINSYDLYHKNKFVYHSVMMEKELLLPRENTQIEIFDINLDFLHTIDYNEIKKGTDLEKALYFFTCDDNEFLSKLYDGDMEMTEIERQRKLVMDNFDSLLYYDRDDILPEEVVLAKKEARKEALKEGRKEGRKEGKIETTKEFIKNMINMNLDLKTIAKATNLSEKKIKELMQEV